MVVGPRGSVGTVGGSEMERLVVDRARDLLSRGESALLTYDLQYRKLGALDLACGGAVDVLIETLDSKKLGALETWLLGIESRRWVYTSTALEPAAGGTRGLVYAEAGERGRPLGEIRQPDGSSMLVEEHPPRPHVLLAGGGHINAALAKQLDGLEYFYTVVDPRPDFCSESRFLPARARHCLEPETFIRRGSLKDFTYAVVCSHSQSLDFDAVRALLESRFAGGIGLIGSRSKKKDFEGRLKGLDFERVEIPIGLDIGAQGVQEIALSIAASLVRFHRAGR